VPEEEHRMQHQTHGRGESRVRKAKRKRKVVEVEDSKEHEKYAGKEMDSLLSSQTAIEINKQVSK
jgi:hypothetical protein